MSACNHPLIRKSFNSLNIRNLYECSNEKELCDFKTNNLILKKKIEVCSECKDGFLVIKQNAESKKYFLGCTNYKKDKSGCNNAKTIF